MGLGRVGWNIQRRVLRVIDVIVSGYVILS